MHAEIPAAMSVYRSQPSASIRPNLSGQHPKSTACELMEKMRSKKIPSKVLRSAVHETSKPVSVPDHERTKVMLQRFNKCSQYHNYVLAIPKDNDTPAKRRKKEEGFEIAKWLSASLPLSRSEASFMGCTATFIPLTTRALGEYGPWQTQVLRHVNFPLVSQTVRWQRCREGATILMSDRLQHAHKEYWLAPEDLDQIEAVPKVRKSPHSGLGA
jgi:hypothetical protein